MGSRLPPHLSALLVHGQLCASVINAKIVSSQWLLCLKFVKYQQQSIWVPHFGHKNPIQQYTPGEEWLERCSAELDLGVLVGSWLNESHHCGQAAKEANSVLSCIRSGAAAGLGRWLFLVWCTGEAAAWVLGSVQGPSLQEVCRVAQADVTRKWEFWGAAGGIGVV